MFRMICACFKGAMSVLVQSKAKRRGEQQVSAQDINTSQRRTFVVGPLLSPSHNFVPRVAFKLGVSDDFHCWAASHR